MTRSGRWNPGSGASKDKRGRGVVSVRHRVGSAHIIVGGREEGREGLGKCPTWSKGVANSLFLSSVPGRRACYAVLKVHGLGRSVPSKVAFFQNLVELTILLGELDISTIWELLNKCN